MTEDISRFSQKLRHRVSETSEMRVLVVDDDLSILNLLKTALEALDNFDVRIAESAEDALDIIEDADPPFDCLLLDIQMPDTDGIVLLRRIRKYPEYEETPAIMLTAMSERAYIDEAFIAGATDYITKPFDLVDLRGRMNAARRLVNEKLKTEDSEREASALKHELEQNTQFDFDDPLVISGADRHLRFTQFDNYIGQLSRGQIFKSYAVAILLQDARTLYKVTDNANFRHIVNESGLGLQSMTAGLDCMFSYRGGGLFLAIIHDEDSLRSFPSEDRLNWCVQAMIGETGNTDFWVDLLVGKPFSMRALSRAGAEAAIRRAIDSVRQRELLLSQGDPMPVDDQVEGGAQVGAHKRRRVYERVLMELYGEESYLKLK